jgi:hypothetical protein
MVPELADVADKLRNNRPAEPVTVRSFLSWFGAQRRGWDSSSQALLCLAHVPGALKPRLGILHNFGRGDSLPKV